MKIWFGIFLGLILAILVSSIKINVMYLTKQKKSLKIRFNVKIGLYLFGFIKIVGISLKEDGIHFLCFTFPYNKMKIDKDSMKFLKNFSLLNILHLLNINLKKFHVDLRIGTENMMLTVFLVFAISTFLSILCAKNRKQINLEKYDYKIRPIYHQNQISFEIATIISISMCNILKTILFARRQTKKKKQDKFYASKIPIKI